MATVKMENKNQGEERVLARSTALSKQGSSASIRLPPASPIDIEFSDVSVVVDERGGFFHRKAKGKKYLLKRVSGRFQSGELTAIMGPSGAGKTTLLNVLTGFSTKGMSGCVRALGRMGAGGSLLRKESCYIMQDDRLMPHLTAMEALELAAKLRLPKEYTSKKRKKVIDDILDTLGLTCSSAVRCSRLSGGQKKRLSIALELVNNPPVIFLDEPTTGLDSSSSVQCIDLLKQLAGGGRTVVMTLHQPSAFLYEMLDHVYVLGQGGCCVYRGVPEMTVHFLSYVGLTCPLYHSPADFVLEVASGDYGDYTKKLVDAVNEDSVTSEGMKRRKPRKGTILTAVEGKTKADEKRALSPALPYNKEKTEGEGISLETAAVIQDQDEAEKKESCHMIEDETEREDLHSISQLSKYRILLGRALWQIHCEWTVTQVRAVLHLVVGAILGALYSGAGNDGGRTVSNMSFLFVSLVYLSYTSMMPAILRFPSELPVIQKEHFNNWYSLFTYYMAFLTATTPVQMVNCMIFCSVAYFGSGQPNDPQRFFLYLLICELVMLRSEGFGLMFGACVNPVNGTFLGALLTAVDIVLAGFIVLVSDMLPIFRYISHLSYLRQGFEGVGIALYGYGRKTLACPEELEDIMDVGKGTYCHLRNPRKILDTFSFNPDNYWSRDVVVLLIWVFGLRIVTYACLRRKLSSG